MADILPFASSKYVSKGVYLAYQGGCAFASLLNDPLTVTSSIVQDLERHSAVTGASVSRLESNELETLRQPPSWSSTTSHESCADFGDGSHAAQGSSGRVSETALSGLISVGHIQNTGVRENRGRKIEMPSGQRTTTSRCNSSLNHQPGAEIIKNNRATIERFPVFSGPTLAVDTTEDLCVHEVSVKDLLRSPTKTNKNRRAESCQPRVSYK
jgi:hypothetical protein